MSPGMWLNVERKEKSILQRLVVKAVPFLRLALCLETGPAGWLIPAASLWPPDPLTPRLALSLVDPHFNNVWCSFPSHQWWEHPSGCNLLIWNFLGTVKLKLKTINTKYCLSIWHKKKHVKKEGSNKKQVTRLISLKCIVMIKTAMTTCTYYWA